MSQAGGVFKTLSSQLASQLDRELMSAGGFSIDQLMELAGLAVAQAIHRECKPAKGKIVMLVGPGNNGGDGLVASRHLKLWGYDPIIYYPKKSTSNELYRRLMVQLSDLEVPEVHDVEEVKQLVLAPKQVILIVDGLFGFSFKPPIRPPFDNLIEFLSSNYSKIAPVLSIDIPSGWDVDKGPISHDIKASVLVSLTAPKPCAKAFTAMGGTHYLGGRFINAKIAKKYGIEDIIGKYENDELIVKL